MNSMKDERSQLPDVRTRIGMVACLISGLCLMVALIQVVTLVGSPEFAGDFDGGTHDADYSGMTIAGYLAIAALASASVGALFGRGGARAVCAITAGVPLFVVAASLVARLLEFLG